MTFRPRYLLALASLSVLVATNAFAGDPATAEVLFREGRALLLEGRLDEACPKLAESVALDSSSGSLLNLALCYEKQNRLATAWATYVNAGRVARAQGIPDRIEEADARAKDLETRLGYISFSSDASYPGLTVTRDGESPLGISTVSSRLPVDAGHHTLEFRAPHYRSTSVDVETKDGETIDVKVPSLEAEPVPIAPVMPPPVIPDRPPPPKASLGPFVVGGVGIASLVAGTITGIVALDSYGRADNLCPTHTGCSQPSMDLRERAEREGWATNVLFGVGIVALTVGVIWLVTSRAPTKLASLPGWSF